MNNCNSVATLIETIADFSEWEEEITRVTAKVAASLAKELLQVIDCRLDKTKIEKLCWGRRWRLLDKNRPKTL